MCVFAGSYVDTVVTFPPFGHHRKGADMVFLSKALKVAMSITLPSELEGFNSAPPKISFQNISCGLGLHADLWAS